MPPAEALRAIGQEEGLSDDAVFERWRAVSTGPAEDDRTQVLLLAAVSHDLRSPLAAAMAAVSCLRSRDLQLTPADQDELLASAGEALDLLSRLASGLLDVTRLQVGSGSVFPRPVDLQKIIGCALAGLGRQALAVRVDLAPGLPEVMADPPVLERVVANVTANALRYSPAGSPPLLTASARGGRIELRIADCGPGVEKAHRDRIFVPFVQLGGTGHASGVGLGLSVSRGLTEAMRGTLEAGDTPGGGLTMTISLPAAPRLPRPQHAEPGGREHERIGSPQRRAGSPLA